MSENISRLHIVAFDNQFAHTADIITLPGGKLLQRERNSVVPFNEDAINIAKALDLKLKINHILPKLHTDQLSAHGISMTKPTGGHLPPLADMRNSELGIPHDHTLEIHNYHTLLAQIEEDPTREADVFFLRSFGSLVLRNT